jgi:hypothetical protein
MRSSAVDHRFDFGTLQSGVKKLFRVDDIWLQFEDMRILPDPLKLHDGVIRSATHAVNIKPSPALADMFRIVGRGVVKHALRIDTELLHAMQHGKSAVLFPLYAATYLKIGVSCELPKELRMPAVKSEPSVKAEESLPETLPGVVIATNTVSTKANCGLSSYAFTFDCLVASFQLKWELRSSKVEVKDLAKHVWKLTLHPSLVKHIQAQQHDLKLPSRTILARAEIKLDVLSYAYWAYQLDDNQSFGYLMIDSSPQGGWDLFACLDDVLCWPNHFTLGQQVAMDIATHWTRRMLPLSCLGKGCSSTFHRAYSLYMKIRLVGGSQCKRPENPCNVLVLEMFAFVLSSHWLGQTPPRVLEHGCWVSGSGPLVILQRWRPKEHLKPFPFVGKPSCVASWVQTFLAQAFYQ